MEPHPVRLVVRDDRKRSRLTVGFRLVLVVPHLLWLFAWSLTAFCTAIVQWFWVLVAGRSGATMHDFFERYVRYTTHVYAYGFLAANPFPGFLGERASYPVDIEVAPPAPQSRWKTGFRGILALPAVVLGGTLAASAPELLLALPGGVALVVAVLGWFVCLVRGRMPQGFRDLVAFALRYNAQTYAYLLFLTERYPESEPRDPRPVEPTPARPIRVSVAPDDLRRSRVTVFFRYLLAFPHNVWILLWGIVALIAAIASWIVTLARGRPPAVLHRFLGAYVRYQTHVYAFAYLVGNPFPGFTGTPGTYPVDVEIDPPAPQRRWITGFRLLLALPALAVVAALFGVLTIVALYGWFVGLALGRMPRGLRDLGAFVLRYWAETSGYLYLLTDRYPYSGPALREPEPEPEMSVAPAA